jgi:hypothetical protein
VRLSGSRFLQLTRGIPNVSDHGGLQGVLRLTFTTPEFLDFGLIAAG